MVKYTSYGIISMKYFQGVSNFGMQFYMDCSRKGRDDLGSSQRPHLVESNAVNSTSKGQYFIQNGKCELQYITVTRF